MIYIDRSRVPQPDILNSEKVQIHFLKAAEHFRSKKAEDTQIRFKMNSLGWRHKQLRVALADLFHNKCAYCESKLSSISPFEVEHFRPKQGAVDLEGNFFSAHYWWLAYEWRNLYTVCMPCNRSKRNRFPVTGPRAVLETPYEDLGHEQSLLLDPCVDKPGKHLVFDERGRIASEHERGQITIEILGLNRSPLVKARRKAYTSLSELWDAWLVNKSPKLQKEIMAKMQPEAEFSALSRQFVLQWTLKGTGLLGLWNKWKSFFESVRSDHETVTTHMDADVATFTAPSHIASRIDA